jgi:hypothetical protein
VIISAMPASARARRPRLSMFREKKFAILRNSTGFEDCKIACFGVDGDVEQYASFSP